MKKIKKCLGLLFSLSMITGIVSCGSTPVNSNPNPTNTSQYGSDEFYYQDPKAGDGLTATKIEITTPPNTVNYKVNDLFDPEGMVVTATYSDSSTAEVFKYTWTPSGALSLSDTKVTILYEGLQASVNITVRELTWEDLDIEVMATVNANGNYTIEAEACDLSALKLQAGCAGFIEEWSANGQSGECIACVAGGFLAFSFITNADCTIAFKAFSAKYENPWDLDANVSFILDDGEPFVTNYTSFGTATGNQWYNWKDVTIGIVDVESGVHTMYMNVAQAFPNTDRFELVVTNYGG